MFVNKKKNTILTPATWTDPENTMLSGSQSQKSAVAFTQKAQNRQIYRQGGNRLVAAGGVGGAGNSQWIKISLWAHESVPKLIGKLCECSEKHGLVHFKRENCVVC